MIGAIAGDMIGAPYEGRPIKTAAFPLTVNAFTDDTVLTVAVANAIIRCRDYRRAIKCFARNYPNVPYGGAFWHWIWDPRGDPYYSCGNGSAMRVSPIGFAYDSIEAVLLQARRSAEVSHNHPEGIKGAQATALAVFLARKGEDKAAIRRQIESRFAYRLDATVAEIRTDYCFDVTCQGSVPESIVAFLESRDYVSAVRNAVSLGGDADTMACIAGAIAQAYYQTLPADLVQAVRGNLPPPLLSVVDEFNETYACPF